MNFFLPNSCTQRPFLALLADDHGAPVGCIALRLRRPELDDHAALMTKTHCRRRRHASVTRLMRSNTAESRRSELQQPTPASASERIGVPRIRGPWHFDSHKEGAVFSFLYFLKIKISKIYVHFEIFQKYTPVALP